MMYLKLDIMDVMLMNKKIKIFLKHHKQIFKEIIKIQNQEGWKWDLQRECKLDN